MPRFGDGRVLYSTIEESDHRKPNIIRGNGVKVKPNVVTTMELAGDVNRNFVEEGALVDEGFLQEEGFVDESSLVQASIQENGDVIVLLRENEILGLHHQQDEVDVEEGIGNGEEEYLEDFMSCDETAAAVQNIPSAGEEREEAGEEESVESYWSGNVEGQEEGQFMLVQLDDGNSYLIHSSQLENSLTDGSTDQILFNENGEQLQLVELEENESNESFIPQPQVQQEPRKRKQTNQSPIQPAKRVCVNGANGNSSLTSNSDQQSRITFHSMISSQSAPKSSCSTSTAAPSSYRRSFRPQEDLKPRPFRFELPEDEISIVDTSTDYLSLVIEQYRKENELEK